MSKSKKHKRGKQRRQVFYETLPLVVSPPTAFPEVRQYISESFVILTNRWRESIQPLWVSLNVARRSAILRIQPVAQQAAKQLELGSRQALHAIQLGAQATAYYAPPIATDMRAVARRAGKSISGPRARSLYIALIAGGMFTLVTAASLAAVSTINSYANDISSPAALLAKKKTGTTILDRNGAVLFEGYGGQDTKVVPLDGIPQSLKDATLSAEDPGFYQHPGFSVRGTARAAFVDFTHRGTIQGGSTLTQQLVKNALLTSNRDFQRKYQELFLAMELERRYSKDQILDMYLNEIYYGQGASGVQAASQTFFHKDPKNLTLSESALLAGLPLGPSRFDPNADLAAATGRRDFVLARMVQSGKITQHEADVAKAEPIQLATDAPTAVDPGAPQPVTVYAKKVSIQAPWFVFYVLDQLRAKYGDDLVEQGGITVQTTLDLKKEQAAEADIAKHIQQLSGHHVTNGGLISLDPSNGDILAMVGSVDYNAPGFGNVNVTLSDLQPGSSFKPIAYATAFKKGWNSTTTVDDAPFSAPNGDGTMYTPQNYDGKFRGKVTLRRALANSLNIPAIKVLQFAGIPETLQTAHDMGVTTLNQPDRYGLSLVLGGGEVRPIDMATVYATLANNGTKVEPRAILRVSDRKGKDITKPEDTDVVRQSVLDPKIAFMLTSILSDNGARTEEFGANSPLKLSRPAAAKTGTTNDFRDNWTVGYTPQIVTAVWVGNNDHTAMNNVDGITGAAPIWHDYMESALADLPVAQFIAPPGTAAFDLSPQPTPSPILTQPPTQPATPSSTPATPVPTPVTPAPPTPAPVTTPVAPTPPPPRGFGAQ